MVFTCVCTLFCLIMFLCISLRFPGLDVESINEDLKESLLPLLANFLRNIQVIKVDKGQAESFVEEIAAMIFLFALESVVLTDIASNVVQMAGSDNYRAALVLIFKFTS